MAKKNQVKLNEINAGEIIEDTVLTSLNMKSIQGVKSLEYSKKFYKKFISDMKDNPKVVSVQVSDKLTILFSAEKILQFLEGITVVNAEAASTALPDFSSYIPDDSQKTAKKA